jgi:hypothetical protein
MTLSSIGVPLWESARRAATNAVAKSMASVWKAKVALSPLPADTRTAAESDKGLYVN